MVNLAKVESKTDISQIKIKVEKLIFLHQQLNEKYRQLESDYTSLKLTFESQAKAIHSLKEENNRLLIKARSSQNTGNLKSKLDDYIHEIDHCLALLKN